MKTSAVHISDSRSPGRVLRWGIGLGKALSSKRVIDAAVFAESLGFHEAWISNERFFRDMFATLGAAAVATKTIGLGAFVADPYTVHPAITAAAMATVDELSDGRAILGLGAGGSGFQQMRIGRTRPLADVRAALKAIRELLSGAQVDVTAPGFEVHNAQLGTTARPGLPLIVASQSPKMLAIGGAEADAVMISTFADEGLFSAAFNWAAKGAEEVGRELAIGDDVIARIDVSINQDRASARDALRPLIGYLLVLLHPRWWFLEELGLALPQRLREISATKDYESMQSSLSLIPDRLIDAFGWTGSPEEIAFDIHKLLEIGIRRFTVLPHARDGNVEEVMRSFARDVIPLVEGGYR